MDIGDVPTGPLLGGSTVIHTSITQYDHSGCSNSSKGGDSSGGGINGQVYLFLRLYYITGNDGDLETAPVLTSWNDNWWSICKIKVLSLCRNQRTEPSYKFHWLNGSLANCNYALKTTISLEQGHSINQKVHTLQKCWYLLVSGVKLVLMVAKVTTTNYTCTLPVNSHVVEVRVSVTHQ